VHDEFLCHVTAYGVCGGQRVGVPLGTYRAPTLALALWWLRDRATWIAERLDPTPDNGVFPVEALTPVSGDTPDVPRTLRSWRDDTEHQEMIAEHLAHGRMIRVATRDETTEYELLAESVDALRMERAGPVPVVSAVPRVQQRKQRGAPARAAAAAARYQAPEPFGDTVWLRRVGA
jgi:hypothetical protein